MSSRRVEKISKVIMATVSDVVQNELSDPRVRGMISVTRVTVAADLRNGQVHLSVFGVDEAQAELSLRAIRHAHGYIQTRLAQQLMIRTCPKLTFHLDDSLKRGAKILELINQVSVESGWKKEDDDEEENEDEPADDGAVEEKTVEEEFEDDEDE